MTLDLFRSYTAKHWRQVLFCLWTVLWFAIPSASGSKRLDRAIDLHGEWKNKISGIVWIAYSPSAANPTKGLDATPDAIRDDLALLRRAGFTGLVTYSSAGVLGRMLPSLAESEGFRGLIVGIWDPSNAEEVATAIGASKNPIVLGFCVGNEGLGKRYELSDLSAQIQRLRDATHKPVTTSEPIDRYSDENLLRLGDWLFPNAHPYFHDRLDPNAAVRWTQGEYEDLVRACKCFTIFKEVGLPTAGDSRGTLSESAQDRYYLELAKTPVPFVYFEAFDQPWKNDLPIESHWGIFNSDRTPKQFAKRLIDQDPPDKAQSSDVFYIYQDADSPDNHFKPTGYMGDIGDIRMDETFASNPHSGRTSIRVSYSAQGKGPNQCSYRGPCKWAGVYWQDPPNNWGEDPIFKDRGFDLSGYTGLSFWARADSESTVKFQVGGIDKPYGDSLKFPRSITARLTTEWQEFSIDLTGKDLSHIIGGFAWVATSDSNPKGVTFYLDDIRFDKSSVRASGKTGVVGFAEWLTLVSNLEGGYQRTDFFLPHYNTGEFQWDSRIELWLPPFRDKFSWGPYLRFSGIALLKTNQSLVAQGFQGYAFPNSFLAGPGTGLQVYPFSSWRFQRPGSKVGKVFGPLRFFGDYNWTRYWGTANGWRPHSQTRAGFDYWKAVNVNEPGSFWWWETWNGLYWQSSNEFSDRYDSVILADSLRTGIRIPNRGFVSTITPYFAIESSRTKYDRYATQPCAIPQPVVQTNYPPNPNPCDFYWENRLLVGGGVRYAPSLKKLDYHGRRWVNRLVLFGEYVNTEAYYGPTAPSPVPRFDIRAGLSTSIGQWYK